LKIVGGDFLHHTIKLTINSFSVDLREWG